MYKNIQQIDSVDVHYETPLMLACVRGYEKVQQKIVDIHQRTYRSKIVKVLLQKGADLNMYLKQGKTTPLHWACFYGDVVLARMLLDFKDIGQKLAMKQN